jgi:thiamine kinase-like enzyme
LVISAGGIIYATTGKPLQPENALNSWREWHGDLRTRPVILKPLSGGRSNRSFLLESEGKRMVLRLNGADSMLPGAGRSHEKDIWLAASDQGIAPPLLHFDEQNRFLVSLFISNSLPPQPLLNETLVNRVFELLNRCHQLEVEAHTIDYASHVEQYLQVLKNKNHVSDPVLVEQRESMQQTLNTLVTSGSPLGLCHHDLVVTNFVGSANSLYLIDWEYAARGLLLMDYASLGVEWGIDDTVMTERTGVELELLLMAKSFYRYLCALWGA